MLLIQGKLHGQFNGNRHRLPIHFLWMKVPLLHSCDSRLVEDIMSSALEYLEGFHAPLCRYFGLQNQSASPTLFSGDVGIDGC